MDLDQQHTDFESHKFGNRWNHVFYEMFASWEGEMGWNRLLIHILPEAIIKNMSNMIPTLIYLPDTENLRLSELSKQALSY